MSNVQFDSLKFRYPFRKHQEMILQSFKNEQLKSKGGLCISCGGASGSGQDHCWTGMCHKTSGSGGDYMSQYSHSGQWIDKFDLFIPEDSNINKDDIIGSNPIH